jgi:spore coat polysaccharide biosynthesis predicted glycosyltransferase SpsG
MRQIEKKILFKASGSFEIGFGHIMRTATLANEIAKFTGADNIFIYCSCPNKAARNIFRPYKFFLRDKDTKEIVNRILNLNIDILLVDEFMDNLELCRTLRDIKPEITIAALDYFNYENNFLNIIINLFNHNPNIDKPGGNFKGRYYEGLDYAIIRDSFKPYIGRDKNISSIVENILITFGGADISNNTLESLDFLDSVGYKGKAEITIGPFFKNKKEILERIKRTGYTCLVHNRYKDIEKSIFEADLGFTGAGTTLMEFCSVGTPAIVIPQNAREYKFANFFEFNNAVKVLNSDNENISIIREVINNKQIRQKMCRGGRGLIDSKGKERIRSIILEK